MREELNFIHSKEDILKALLQCKEEQTSIGIQSDALGTETVVTGIEDIVIEDTRTLVVLKYYDTTGYILPSNKIVLEEIQAVFPFATTFENPYLNNLNKGKSWHF